MFEKLLKELHPMYTEKKAIQCIAILFVTDLGHRTVLWVRCLYIISACG